MSEMEFVLNMLAETTTTELSKVHNPQGIKENKEIARRGGNVAGETRKSIESETGKPVITNQNAIELNAVVTNVIETVAKEEPKDKKE